MHVFYFSTKHQRNHSGIAFQSVSLSGEISGHKPFAKKGCWSPGAEKAKFEAQLFLEQSEGAQLCGGPALRLSRSYMALTVQTLACG